jgi:hypothetical protein
MRKIPVTIPLLIIGLLLFFSACATPAPLPGQPAQDALDFQLTSDATPGDTDSYASYTFGIALSSAQELEMDFSAEGAKILVSILTPSDDAWGYNPHRPEDIGDGKTGFLNEARSVAVTEGCFIFSAPETGEYLLTVKSASPQAEISVHLEYQIR